MKSALLIASLIVGLLAPRLQAQEPSKVPGPEAKKLEMFTGRWRFDDTVVANPFGGVGKGIYHSDIRMVQGGFFVEERGKGKNPDGKDSSWILYQWYDVEARTYRMLQFERDGSVTPGTFTVEGDVVSGYWDQKTKDRVYKCRWVTRFAPDHKSNTYESSFSEDGLVWKPWLSGKGKRLGKAR